MNYRHAFHAGNFADVFKHVVLARILAYLAQKPAAFRVIETHAGDGLYDLGGPEAERTAEWRAGIGRLIATGLPPCLEPLFAPYLAVVAPLLAEAPPLYPGSPRLAAALLRRQDRMIFCEAHPEALAVLRKHMGRDARAKIIAIDGFTGLAAFVPPVERRGLVLIDPPFEAKEEFARIAAAVEIALRKWPTGCYMIWYPIKDRQAVAAFYRRIGELVSTPGVRGALRLELWLGEARPDAPLASCGLVIVNPPYRLEEETASILPYLAQTLGGSEMAGQAIARF